MDLSAASTQFSIDRSGYTAHEANLHGTRRALQWVGMQEFMQEDMGVMLTMTPNYEDFSCQFSFGQTPEPQSNDEAFLTPCFQQCPSKRQRKSMNQCHDIATTQNVAP